jgi:RNase H-fold protein (predicted Holliday junction resolvase)
MSLFISVDPGNKKCGLLLADVKSGNVIEAGISSLNKFSDLISTWNQNYQISKIIIGDGTNYKYFENVLKQKNILNLNFVNERGSTLRARFRYWEMWPPNYFIRWLPKEMLFPPENLDAVVALILLEDFLKCTLIWPENVSIKIWP